MKTPKMPPIKFFVSGTNKELTVKEAKEHIRELAKLKSKPA